MMKFYYPRHRLSQVCSYHCSDLVVVTDVLLVLYEIALSLNNVKACLRLVNQTCAIVNRQLCILH